MSFCALVWLVAGCGNALRPTSVSSPIDASNLKEAWDANNDPKKLRDRYEVQLAALPLAGEADQKPWTDSYWPSFRAGLANRWGAQANVDPFTYTPPTKEEVQAMPVSQLRTLSPAEKYDILTGHFDYPLLKMERAQHKPTDPTWWGLCHGWAPASLHFVEPRPVTVKTVDGIDLPFGSSDVKALLIMLQQYQRPRTDTRMLGARCDRDPTTDPTAPAQPECKDVNAGSFHIIVTNQLGLEKTGFVADIERHEQVWNHPIYGFKSQIVSESDQVYPTAAPGTVKIAKVYTTLNYIMGSSAHWDAIPYAPDAPQAGKLVYAYNLELNAAGEIIGGEWIQDGRPDFLWTQKDPTFAGFFKEVERVYQASIQR